MAADSQLSASMVAARLAGWVIGRMAEDAVAFGMVAPVSDGVVMFLRGPVWCSVTEGGSTRQLSGERALTWVDQIVPSTFDQLAVGTSEQPVQPDPVSDLRDGVVPGQGFVLTRLGGRGLGCRGVGGCGVSRCRVGGRARPKRRGRRPRSRGAGGSRAGGTGGRGGRKRRGRKRAGGSAQAEAARAEAARAEAARAEAARAEAARAEAARAEARAGGGGAGGGSRGRAARAEAARAERPGGG